MYIKITLERASLKEGIFPPEKNLDLDNFGLISSNLGLDNHENCSLGRVSISTILKSESRPDLDLDSLGNISLVPISISTIF